MARKSKKPIAGIPAAAEKPIAADSAKSTGAWPESAYPAFSLEEIADLSRGNIAALTKSNLALAEGWQAIGEEVLSYARTSFTSASRAATALLEARTFDQVVQLNTDLAKTNLEVLLAGSAKLSGLGLTVASETLSPLGDRVEATFARLVKTAA